jgi:hypothetical protein
MTKHKFFFKKKIKFWSTKLKINDIKNDPQKLYELTNQKDIKKNKWKKNDDSMC